MKKDIRLKIVDSTMADTEENFYNDSLVKTLQKKFNVIYADKPDFIIYGPYGFEHLNYDCVRIFYTGENVRADFNVADYAIDFDYMEFGDRHFQLFHGALRDDFEYIATKHLSNDKNIESKSKFCAYMVSNEWRPFTDIREACFDGLSEYKKVDSGGKHKNNIGGAIAQRNDGKNAKIEWLKDYKFNLCFENSSYPGYLTEKLFDAFSANCVPIYWGDTALALMGDANDRYMGGSLDKDIYGGGGGNLDSKYKNIQIDMNLPHIKKDLIKYKINPKAFINAHNFPNLAALIDEVKRIDNDKDAFRSMLKEPVFLTDIDTLRKHKENLNAFLESIFTQEPKDAFRRGRGQWLWLYQENKWKIIDYHTQMRKVNDVVNLMRYHRISKLLNEFLKYRVLPRDILKKIRAFFKPKKK